jgi:hypothetical protein
MTPRQQSVLIGATATVAAGVPSMSYFDLIPDHLFFLDFTFGVIVAPILGGIVAVQQYTSRAGTSAESKLKGGGAELSLGPVLGALAAAGGLVISIILSQALHVIDLGFQGWISNAPQMQKATPGTIVAAAVGFVGIAAVHCIVGGIGGAIGTRIFGDDE